MGQHIENMNRTNYVMKGKTSKVKTLKVKDVQKTNIIYYTKELLIDWVSDKLTLASYLNL